MLRLLARWSMVFVVAILLTLIISTPSSAQALDCTGVTDIPATECAVLMNIYTSTNGLPTYPGTPDFMWFDSATACTWRGVTCTGGNITGLILNGVSSGTLTLDYSGLTLLEGLEVGNTFTGIGDVNGFVFPANLRIFQLGNSNITGNLSTVNFPATLETLDIINQDVLTGNIATITLPPALTYLRIHNTSLTGDIASANFPVGLQTLDLSITNVMGNIDGATLPPNLIYIDIVQTAIGGDLALTTLPVTLQDARLAVNNIGGNIANVNWPPALQKLNLSANNLYGDIAATNFANGLIILSAMDTNISGNIANFVFPNTLEWLILNNSSVFGDIAGMNLPATLVWLHLPETNVVGEIGGLTLPNGIETVDFAQTQVTGDINIFATWPASMEIVLLNHTNVYGTFNFTGGAGPGIVSDLPFAHLELGCTAVVAGSPEAEVYLNFLSYNTPWSSCDLPPETPFGNDEPAPPSLNDWNSENADEVRAEAYGVDDNVYGTVLMDNGAWQFVVGSVPEELIDYGVIMAIDIWVQNGDQYFDTYERVCLLGEGRLIYLDATQSPRSMAEIPVDFEDGYTCGWIPNAGTLVLIEPE